ncbi:MAG: hypothetical protein GY731_15195, partial [Gammaproteobacteria bacterium]|nr:hypothetical protein [Gammaproteobacteria bacterium]
MFFKKNSNRKTDSTPNASTELPSPQTNNLLTAIALEPRIMFDGAALVDAVDPQIAEPLVIEAPAPVPEVAEPQAKTNEIVFV